MAMFNCLEAKFSPKVKCSSPATDHYEVENLISEDYREKLRGFIAFPSTKPPVELDFHFLCPINLHFIKLNTTVGAQKCTGIELFAKSSYSQFVSISKALYTQSQVVFCNSRKYSMENPPPLFEQQLHHLGFFKSNTFRVFLNAVAIKIVIFRTEKSVPCMQSVEAWGTPSKFCSPQVVKSISLILNEPVNEDNVVEGSVGDEEQGETSGLTIPEDFKDDLTYELMACPMTLPSGKTIDRSTLDKHTENEALFGRKPGDPFTGVKFTEHLKPVLNVALKSRIDMFLLKNSDNPRTFGMKRCLGGQRPMFTPSNPVRDVCDEELNDLERAVKKAKIQPNFISFQEPKTLTCVSCKKTQHFYYEISCKHLFCRACLLRISQYLICSFCDEPYLRSDVKKINV